MDVAVHHLVDVDKVDDFAEVGEELLDEWAALESFLMAEVEGLGCVEELDGEHAFDVLHHAVALGGCVAAHADEVFLVLAAGDAVDAAGGAELLGLADDGCCGVLRNHEAAVEAGLGDEEGGEASLGVDELVGASFADGAEFGDGDGEEVEDHGEGFAVEVAAGDDHILVGEDDGVVGGGVDFGLDDATNVGYGVLGGTVDLRGAAEAVGILHVFFVAGDDLAALGVAAYGFGGLELTFMRTNHVEALKERLDAAVEGVEAEAENHIGLLAEALGFHEAPNGIAAHELCAVEQGETLFALQFDGLPALGFVYLFGGAAASFPVDFAHSEDGGEHEVCERAEVAAGTEAALLVDYREDVVVEAVDEALDGLQLCSAVAEGEVLGLEKEHESNNLLGHFVANTAGVAHDEVFLELAELLFADADVAE